MKILKHKKLIFVTLLVLIVAILLISLNKKKGNGVKTKVDDVATPANISDNGEVQNALGWKKGSWWKVEFRQYAPWKFTPTWTPPIKIIFEVTEVKSNPKEAVVKISYENTEEASEVTKNDVTIIVYDLDTYAIKSASAVVSGTEYNYSGEEVPSLLPYYSLYSIEKGFFEQGEEKEFTPDIGKFQGQKFKIKKVKVNEGESQTWALDQKIPYWLYFESANFKATLIDKSD